MEAWVLVNTHAGRQRARQNGEQIRRVFALGGARTRLAYTESPQEGEDFLEQAAAAQPDLLVFCGGDGTLSHGINCLGRLGAKIPLGYVPLGTTNDFARSLGLPKEPARAAEQILHGSAHRLDLGRFGDRALLYVASFGAFTQSSYKAEPRVKAALGHLAYVLESVRELPSLRPQSLRVEAGDVRCEGEFLFGAVTNTLSVGGVVKLDPETVRLDDGLLELTLVRMPKNPVELGQAVRMLHQCKYDGDLVIQQPVRRAVFTCPEPFPWSLDGEYVPGGESVQVEALPQVLELML